MSIKDKLLLMITGMGIGLNWVLLFMAYDYTSVAAATLANYFAPVIVMIICPLLFKEKARIFQYICFFMATFGLILVISGGGMENSGNIKGIVCGLLAACFYAAAVLMNKFIKVGNDLERTIWQFFGAVLILSIMMIGKGELQISEISLFGLGNLLILGIVHTGICYLLYFSSIRDLKGAETAILSYIDPLMAILISVFYYKEQIFPLQWAGAIFILGFTCLYELFQSKKALHLDEQKKGSYDT